MNVGLIQIPHQPQGAGTSIACSLLTHRQWSAGPPRPSSLWDAGEHLSWSPPDPSLSLQQECCGTSGPMDWVNFTSAFRATTPEVVFPWPPLCCRRTGNFIPVNEEGCRLGHLDYLFTKVCLLLLCLSVWPSLVLLSLSPSRCLSVIASPTPIWLFQPSICPPSTSPTPHPTHHLPVQVSGMHTAGLVWSRPGDTWNFSQVVWGSEQQEQYQQHTTNNH